MCGQKLNIANAENSECHTGNFREQQKAVSYTHLDVYKRQTVTMRDIKITFSKKQNNGVSITNITTSIRK